MAEEIAFETGKFSSFEVLVTLTLELKLHGRASVIDLYLHANLIEIEEFFKDRRTYSRMDKRTDGH